METKSLFLRTCAKVVLKCQSFRLDFIFQGVRLMCGVLLRFVDHRMVALVSLNFQSDVNPSDSSGELGTAQESLTRCPTVPEEEES
jgi:hypothetical protein